MPCSSSPAASWRFENPGRRDAAIARTSIRSPTSAGASASKTPIAVDCSYPMVNSGFTNSSVEPPLRPSGLLLFGQDCVEHGLLNVRLQRARGGIDEGVGTTVFDLRVFLLHVVLGAVIAELDVAGQRAHGLERAVELVDKRGRQHRGRAQAAS